MWNKKKVSVILPTYNEKESIQRAIEDFQYGNIADEIIVINNNAAPGTSEKISKTTAREVFETRQGYGAAIRRGFKEATGDYIIVSEPDGTFCGKDVVKLLSYIDDFNVVYGTRTLKELIWSGANMGFFLRWGNYWTAKLIEICFNTTSLSDVGCTMRCVRKDALRKMEPYFSVDGNTFGPEMIIISTMMKMKIIQIPVNYAPRVGRSSVTGNPLVAFFLGLRMIYMIITYRIKSWLFPNRYKKF
ncbi:MAG TPA: glycosyltransferase family 2 protein [Desulfobacteraceae bacterium]|nr:glycosyltransferase family 2 protein [Desulfobacteraceae bacterium]HPJ67687.1 glycosyltransferase family 2 protein [Desulfobacteraceae bacterium]HPQ27819.1 glycosyltransferase family 2 protein [Desulfobacteraceae bacterium]